MRKAFLIACAAGLSLLLSAPVSAQLIFDGFGDSITQGYPYISDPPNGARVGGYEPTLEALISSTSYPAYVHNHGVGGERTSSGLFRIDGVLDSFERLEFMLLLEGTNDLLPDGISPESIYFNLGAMVDKIRARGVVPIIGTLTPDDRSFRNKRISETNSLIRQLVAEKGILLCDLHAAMAGSWSSWSDDLLHPDEGGYVKMGEVWFSCLPPLQPPPEPEPEPEWAPAPEPYPDPIPIPPPDLSPLWDLLLGD
jgi:lysophospholipase L1-like esterase